MASSATVTTPSEREIVITRLLDAPRVLVFRAWTNPQHVMQWWGPKGFVNTACEIDLRVGGRFCLQMRGPDGVTYPCQGTFHEIVEPERIVYSGQAAEGHPCGAGLPPRSTVTVTFVEQEGKTLLTISTRLESAADREAATKAGYNVGWASSLERLEEWLENK